MTNEIEEALGRINNKLARLRSHDGRFRVFGATSHNYRLVEPLSVEALAKFEAKHGIELPEGYRDFLLKIGNGGPGPAYGLHDLSRAFHNPWIPLGALANPFLLEEMTGDNRAESSNYEGCLMISQRGCGGWTFLVVTGPFRGQVWHDNTVNDSGFILGSQSFLYWYENWLVSSLETIDKESALPQEHRGYKLIQELREVAEKTPYKLPQAIERLPSEQWVVGPLCHLSVTLLQEDKATAALPLFNHLYDLPVPESGRDRRIFLEALNNGIIAACMAQKYVAAANLSDRAQPFVQENPYIAHSAACAYVSAGDNDKALEQCRLAVVHKYELLDQLVADSDLAPLRKHPKFKELFDGK